MYGTNLKHQYHLKTNYGYSPLYLPFASGASFDGMRDMWKRDAKKHPDWKFKLEDRGARR